MWGVQNLGRMFSFESFSVACVVISSSVLMDLFLCSITKLLISKDTQQAGDEVIFFSDRGDECRTHIYTKVSCDNTDCAYANVRKIIQYIELANETLDVCVYHLTLQDLAYSILKLHMNGVKIRIIADADMVDNSGSQIKMLKKQGVSVFAKKSSNFMHHKFLIVDHKILITCCLNWTLQAVAGNWESVVITSEKELLKPFDAHFEEVLEIFGKYAD